ncbi:hypothetical protein HZC07_06085 [Candidatus Micrarchaeota archaeon]|nr:hypothetical protein [Candidatus Micrarchaeota archaeon]
MKLINTKITLALGMVSLLVGIGAFTLGIRSTEPAYGVSEYSPYSLYLIGGGVVLLLVGLYLAFLASRPNKKLKK